MKKLLCSWFLLVLIGSFGNLQMEALNALPQNTAISIHLVKIQDEEPENEIPTHPIGRRSKRIPLSGEITSSGVSIPGVEISDIISFEIYDPSGICLGIYSDEMDFVNALFSLSGEFEIVFVTENTTFAGIVEV